MDAHVLSALLESMLFELVPMCCSGIAVLSCGTSSPQVERQSMGKEGFKSWVLERQLHLSLSDLCASSPLVRMCFLMPICVLENSALAQHSTLSKKAATLYSASHLIPVMTFVESVSHLNYYLLI